MTKVFWKESNYTVSARGTAAENTTSTSETIRHGTIIGFVVKKNDMRYGVGGYTTLPTGPSGGSISGPSEITIAIIATDEGAIVERVLFGLTVEKQVPS